MTPRTHKTIPAEESDALREDISDLLCQWPKFLRYGVVPKEATPSHLPPDIVALIKERIESAANTYDVYDHDPSEAPDYMSTFPSVRSRINSWLHLLPTLCLHLCISSSNKFRT